VATPQPTLSVLVPVYNNQHTLPPLVERLHRVLEPFRYELIFVNDGSRDGSLGILRSLAAADARVKVISLSRNYGQHPAIAAALDAASGDVLALMDADLQDHPEHLPELLRELGEKGVDLVYTTKVEAGQTARGLTSDLYHRVFSNAVGVVVPRHLGTYRLFTRKVRNALRQFPERHVLYGPLMFYVGFKFVIVPISRGASTGPSSYTFSKRLRLAVNSLVTYSDLPPKLFAGLGITMVILPLLYGAIVLAQYIAVGRSLPQGLTVIVLLLSGLGGIIMLALGVLGVYIFRIFQEVLARPRYLVDETINLGAGDQPDGRA
jgi:dolichol-phosphate mannosyltransferase